MLTHILHWGLYLSMIRFYLPFEKNDYKYTSFKLRISSNLVSLTHALGTIGGSAYILYNNNLNNFDSLSNEVMTLMTFSASYFIYDLIMMMFTTIDIIFFLHHLLILMVYWIVDSYNYGAKFVILSILWGEITNPLQITWRISRVLNYKKIENYVFPAFSASFIIVRTVVLPFIHYNMLSSMFENKDYYVPTLGLIALSALGNIGGMIWTRQILNKLICLRLNA
jgi:hypothetical protein